MKTSEFYKRIEAMGLEHLTHKNVIQVVDGQNPFTDVIVATVHTDCLWACHVFDVANFYMTKRVYKLVTEYAETPLDDRQDERKWVIPWGIDTTGHHTQTAWSNVYKRPATAFIVGNSWKNNEDYHFTDSEIERLKSSQSPAIAQAIDIAKELVTDE